MKKIKIIKGDEYRAKKEIFYDQDSFFCDVYADAEHILYEIIFEMIEFKKQIKDANGKMSSCHGMGNNIIAFCAARGYGKTSALRSFSTFLQTSGVVSKDLKNNWEFVVLESVDPSNLDSGESIVRVLISRLFFRFCKYIEDNSQKLQMKKNLEADKREILRLFQKCFDNIDYLQRNKERDDGLDDLEYLAQLGDSGKLKENLFELVQKFLYFTDVREECDNKKRFLVITVDDADLSMGDTFKICEDIRNYFSIPNVIVLLAANYDQLHYAIYQRYLERYEKVLLLDRKIQKNHFLKRCMGMTSRYLEKMLPSGHRIDLPKMEEVLVKNYEELEVEYLGYVEDLHSGKKELRNLLEKEFEQCHDMQDQLLKLIYLKTGIVFLKQEHEYHSIMPRSLRELTHLLKLLYEMPTIDQSKVRQQEKMASDLQKNINRFKQYFMDYWCVNRMKDKRTYDLIKEIDEINQNGNTNKVWNKLILEISRKNNEENAEIAQKEVGQKEIATYQRMLAWLHETGYVKKKESFYDALCLYYTIFLNEYFARVCINPNYVDSLVDYIQMPIEWPEQSNLKMKSYNVVHFDVLLTKLQRYFPTNNDLKNKNVEWILEHFCRKNGRQVVTEELYDNMQDAKTDHIEFDLLYPLLYSLKDIMKADSGMGEIKTDNVDSEEEIVDRKEVDIIDIKRILANYDVQNHIKNKLLYKFKQLERTNEIYDWQMLCLEIYESCDNWLKDCAGYLGEESQVAALFREHPWPNQMQMGMFLSETNNEEAYFADYKKYTDCLEAEVIKLNEKYRDSEGNIKHTIGPEDGKPELSSQKMKEKLIIQMISQNDEDHELLSKEKELMKEYERLMCDLSEHLNHNINN